MTTITALITPGQDQTPEDCLYAALATQHERALIEKATAYVAKFDGFKPAVVGIEIRYADGAGEAEYDDCADRLNGTQCMGIDAIRIDRRKGGK